MSLSPAHPTKKKKVAAATDYSLTNLDYMMSGSKDNYVGTKYEDPSFCLLH